jgi:CO/xanthine dehydrogenase Mo-binding subunit
VLDRAKRGFGDLPVVAAAPAAALAVAQAVGRPVTDGPLSPERLACGDPA